jgi:hypothetical protein
MTNYTNKYIKYKNKYLSLLKQIAGSYNESTFLIGNIDKLEFNKTYIFNKNIYKLILIEIQIKNNRTLKTEIISDFDYDYEFNFFIQFKIGDTIDYESNNYTLLDIIYTFEDSKEKYLKISKENMYMIGEIKQFNLSYIDVSILHSIKLKNLLVSTTLNYLKDTALIEKINKLSEHFMKPFLHPLEGTNYVRMLTSAIQSNNFSSLYDFKDETVCLKKKRSRIIDYINTFNKFCEISEDGQYLFPKKRDEFYLFRFEYISNYDFFLKEITSREKIYYCPFSTTYNFDLNWINANVLYVYKIPERCNYFYLYEQSQNEVTLQQGKAQIINIYHYNHINERIIIILCNFIPMSVEEAISILPPQCV